MKKGLKMNDAFEDLVLTIKNSEFFEDKIFICGNGGSFSSAQHFVMDLNKYTKHTAYCLGSNSAYLTAIANDLSYDDVFLEEFKKLSAYRNIIIMLSVSGESKNIIKLLKYANEVDDMTYGITGNSDSTLAKFSRRTIVIPERTVAKIEDAQLVLLHNLVERLK